jgi:hypothetical protein
MRPPVKSVLWDALQHFAGIGGLLVELGKDLIGVAHGKVLVDAWVWGGRLRESIVNKSILSGEAWQSLSDDLFAI